MEKIGESLKNERLYRNLSQAELAKKVGITQQAISLYEKNINEPTISVCIKIADIYGITIDELIGRNVYNTKNSIIYNHSTHNGDNKF